MSKEIFKNLPDTSTPLNASRLNGLLNGNEAMGNIVVEGIRGKNLFDKNNMKFGYFINAEGIETLNENMSMTNYFIKVEPNLPLTLSCNANSYMYISEYDNAKGHIKTSGIDGTSNQFTIITDTRTEYVIISNGKDFNDKLQLEIGTTATEYTPYKNFDNTEYVLYDNENGSYDSIVLSDSVTNYKYIEIFFCAENNHNSLKVYNPNEKNVYLGIDVIYSDAAYVKKSKWWILNNSIAIGVAFNYTVENLNRITSADNSPSVAITRVVGYK